MCVEASEQICSERIRSVDLRRPILQNDDDVDAELRGQSVRRPSDTKQLQI